MISYNPFWDTLKRKNISTYTLREKHNVNSNTLFRMRRNEYLSLRTIEDLCKILDCKIDEIVEYIQEPVVIDVEPVNLFPNQ